MDPILPDARRRKASDAQDLQTKAEANDSQAPARSAKNQAILLKRNEMSCILNIIGGETYEYHA
jgi:hypothetical protein